MKIDHLGGSPLWRAAQAGRETATRRPDGAAPTGSERSDQVTLSSRASQASNMVQTLASAPDVRAGLIARLREEIANGSYKVSAHRLADGLLAAGVLSE